MVVIVRAYAHAKCLYKMRLMSISDWHTSSTLLKSIFCSVFSVLATATFHSAQFSAALCAKCEPHSASRNSLENANHSTANVMF